MRTSAAHLHLNTSLIQQKLSPYEKICRETCDAGTRQTHWLYPDQDKTFDLQQQ